MSRIFNVLILSGYCTDLENNLPLINKWLDDNNHNSLIMVNDAGGGEKVVTCGVALAAFNHLEYLSFWKFLKSLNWKSNADLLVQGSYIYDDEWFRTKIINRECGHSKYLH